MAGEWQTVRLQDVTTILGDGLHGTPEYDDLGDYYFVNGNNLKDGRISVDEKTRRVNQEEYEKYKKNLNERTILVSINGTLGNIALYAGEKVVLGKSACYFNVRDDVSLGFVRYVVTGRQFQDYIHALATGSTIKNVSLRLMREFSFQLPPIEEQRAIANILGTLDDNIELNRRRNQTLEAMARALFKDWFVDFGPVRAKMEGREPYLPADIWQLFPDQLDDEGKPEGWEILPLSTIATLVTTSVSPGKLPEAVFEHYSIPAFDSGRMPAIEMGESIKSNKYIVDPNAVLVSKLNPQTPRVWLPVVATERAICSTEFMQFVPNDQVNRPFLYCLMSSQMMQEEVLKHVTGSTGSRQRAQPSQITKVDALMPQATLLTKFNRQTAPILKAVTENQLESQTLAALRDTLLPKLISGALLIKDAEKFLERAEDNVPNKERRLP